MKLLIVIVNYRTADLLIDCLRSIAPQIEPGIRVVVTDNASGDDSILRLSAAIQQNNWKWCELMPLPRNGGFAYGNNAAIAPALKSNDPPEYVLLLNPDTVLRDRALAALLEFMDANRNVGIAGSRLEDPDGTPQRSAFRFHSIASEFERGIRLGLVTKILASKIIAPPVSDVDCPTDCVA